MRNFPLLALITFLWLATLPAPARAENGAAAFEKAIENAKTAMMADPQDALRSVDIALAKSEALAGREKQVARATGLWLKIEANIGLNRINAAQGDLVEALTLVKAAAPGTKLHGDLMRSQGAVAAIGGKASQALRHYLEAHRIFKLAKERRSQAIALQDIGQIYWEAGDYERMLAYFDDAQEIYNDDPAFSLSGNNNRGEAYRILGRRAEAEQAYLLALGNARAMESPMLETRILSNLALVQVEMGKLKLATRNAALAEQLGANAEARDWLPFVYGVKATIAVKEGNDRLGLAMLEKLFAGVDLKTTDLTYKEFHKLAADVYSRLGQPAAALLHLQAFQRLDSETKDLVTSASSQLLEARFNSANQKTQIAERDIKIERQRRDLLTGLLLAALVIIAVGGFAFFSIRKSRNKVRDANTVLTDVNGKLELAMKAKTDFLAMTSHEIRTPLNGIMGMTQVILADDRIDPLTRERVGLVLGAGQTMQSLVDDLLDTAKMENSDIAVDKAPCDLRAILSESVQLWEAEATAKGLQIEFVENGIPAAVHTDGARFRQVVFNLLANAIKFTPTGWVRLTASNRNGAIEIMVEDSGIGIPEDQQEMIFEKFHQVDNAMARNYGGAGLGLAICRNIMTALGGTIGMTSSPGNGSRFQLVLPVEADLAIAATNPANRANNAHRVLIVDGDELRLAKIKTVVETQVDEVLCATTIEAAENCLEEGLANLLVVDTTALTEHLAQVSALRTLSNLASSKNIPSIFLVPSDDDGTYSVVQAFKPYAVLRKPLKASLLLRAIAEVWQVNERRSEAA